jgi:hypothetical protein
MRKALHTFDAGLARNPRVRINEKAGGWISVTPLTAQPERENPGTECGITRQFFFLGDPRKTSDDRHMSLRINALGMFQLV